MLFEPEEHFLNGRHILLRAAREDEARMLVDYLRTVTGETRFLMCGPDEVKYTETEEARFIRSHNESADAMLMLAFVDGGYAGNCSFEGGDTKRKKHRAGMGIALFQRYTGFGLGRLMLERMLDRIRRTGFEQAELTVVEGNDRAYRLYERLGFRECGRIPNANKYADGAYADDILMALRL